jgi:GT2 family glycosyltransferase/glycosyltransferase involved in cell wall biosynthesis
MSGVATQSRRISTVIACHNRRDTTLRCLDRLHAAAQLVPDLRLETILVDDGSRDGTASAVTARFPDTRIIQADGALWWAGAMELGLRACDPTADFQLWLNDDVLLRDDALARLIDAHDCWRDHHGQPPIIVGAVVAADDGAVTFGGGRRLGSHPLRSARLALDDQPQRCELINGNVVLVPAPAAARLGGIDPVFIGVQGMADTDYGLRAIALGVDVIVAPGSVGVCARDRRPPPWRDPDLGVVERLRAITGPRGCPWRPWLTFVRRHGGPWWPVWWAAPLVKRFATILVPDRSPAPRVALVEGVVPDYRLGLMRELAKFTHPRFIVYHGDGQAGLMAAGSTAPLPIASRRGRNLFWPRLCGGRVVWSAGVLETLTGGFDAMCVGLHTHDLGIWVLWLARRVLGRPRLMISGHFAFSQPGPWPLGPARRFLRRCLARGADAVLPYTEEGAEQCRAAGIAADRVFVSGNSVDVAAARAAMAALPADALDAMRRRHGLADRPIFLFLGRLYPGKRVDAAIAAMRELARRGVRANLLIVGSGVEEARLKALAADLPDVRFAAAEFDSHVLAALFMLATAVIVPGAVGLVAAHAAAHGAPLIACHGGAPHGPEFAYLRHDENSLLTEAVDPVELALAMERLCRDSALRARLRQGAWRTGDDLGLEQAANAYAMAARRAIGLSPGGGPSP